MGGGSQTTETKIPEWLEDAAKNNLARANELAKIGYTPYYGPDVAAMTPMQISSMRNNNSAARAFGLGTVDPMAGMPKAQNYNGMMAYSSGDGYDRAVAELRKRRPGQYDALMAPFLNPTTGADPNAPYNSTAPTAPTTGGADANASSGTGPVYTGGQPNKPVAQMSASERAIYNRWLDNRGR